MLALLVVAAAAAVASAAFDLRPAITDYTVRIGYKTISQSSCEWEERCVSGTGNRKLLIFAAEIRNL
jgi:hypothetical protein